MYELLDFDFVMVQCPKCWAESKIALWWFDIQKIRLVGLKCIYCGVYYVVDEWGSVRTWHETDKAPVSPDGVDEWYCN